MDCVFEHFQTRITTFSDIHYYCSKTYQSTEENVSGYKLALTAISMHVVGVVFFRVGALRHSSAEAADLRSVLARDGLIELVRRVERDEAMRRPGDIPQPCGLTGDRRCAVRAVKCQLSAT